MHLSYKKFLSLALLPSLLLWTACSTPKKPAHQPLSSKTNRKISSSGVISYNPDQLTVSSHDGRARSGNSLSLSLDDSVIAHASITRNYSFVESMANFLNLKISEAKAKNKNILVNHDQLARVTTTDGTGGVYRGINEEIFYKSMMIEGLHELPGMAMGRFPDKYGVILEPQRISLKYERNLVGKDDLIVLVDDKAVIAVPIDQENEAEALRNSFELLKQQANEANESIHFNFLYTLNFVHTPAKFMYMFRLESDLQK